MLGQSKDPVELELKDYLQKIGDCVVVVSDDEIVKVHVHTNDPGLAIQKALSYGQLTSMKIDNMREEHHEKVIRDASKIAAKESSGKREEIKKTSQPRKKTGFIVVSSGDGLSDIFYGLKADYIIEGGQTMNPSAQDIADAVQKINASSVFVFPNNSNVILAAEQAKALVTNRTIHVIPTKNVAQGFAAALQFNAEASVPENKTNMTHAIDNVASGQVTYAVRNTTMNGFKLKEGDIIGLDNKRILAKGENIEETTLKLVKALKNDEHEMITLYYGKDVTEDAAAALAAKVQEEYPDCDVDFHFGGQPVYYYMVSLE